MANAVTLPEIIPVDRIFLDPENPRHEPCDSQAEIIEYLCRDNYVLELAKDIVKHGLNPLELFALIPLPGNKKTPSYVVREGNRRMCAIKLLNDPELAPANKRKSFKQLADKSPPMDRVRAMIFPDRPSVRHWLDRIHNGLQGGIGRQSWNAEQKTRHFGDKKNALAQALLDYAEKHKFLSADDRKGTLTTVQRYLGNALLKEVLGLDNSNPEEISRTRQKQDFDLLLKTFIRDLLSGTVNSRANSTAIEKYSRALGETPGQTRKRVEPESLAPDSKPEERKKKPKRPKKPTHPRKITYEDDIHKKLKAIPSLKLERLYYSLCSIDLEQHTPLLSVGAWSFLESLTAKAGRNSGTDFPSFLSKAKFQSLGFTDSNRIQPLVQAVKRIAEYGNTTKHDEKAAHFNGGQLNNDIETLKDLICRLAEEAKK